MKTRCKFRCDKISETVSGHSAELWPVAGTSEENKKFFASTPSGKLELNLVTQRFVPGKEYYIDIEEVN